MMYKQLLKSKENTTRIWPKELLLRFPVDASFSARFPLAVSFPAVNAYCRSPAHVACCKFSRAYCLFQVPALASWRKFLPRLLLVAGFPRLPLVASFPPLPPVANFPVHASKSLLHLPNYANSIASFACRISRSLPPQNEHLHLGLQKLNGIFSFPTYQ